MKKSRTSLGCLFWIALILLVLVIFLFNKKQIDQVVRSTGLIDLIRREKPASEDPEVKRIEIPSEEEPSDDNRHPIVIDTTPSGGEPSNTEPPRETPSESPSEIRIPSEEPQSSPPANQQEGREKKMRRSALYFVQVDDEGTIHMRRVDRPVYYIDSPLTETMRALIAGLLPEEIDKGYLSLIPADTKIISIVVKDDTATLNFNESFRFNPFGPEGYIAQLEQIVYTATEFPTVKRVRFLIDGKSYTYLSPEGIDISKPLTRASFGR